MESVTRRLCVTWLVQRADTDGKYVPLDGSRGRNVSLAEWVTSPSLAAVLCPLPCSWLGAGARPHLGSALECCHAWSLFFAAIFAGGVAGLCFGAGEREEWCPRRCLSLFLGVASKSSPSSGKCWWCPVCDVIEVAEKFCTLAFLFVSWCTMAFSGGEREVG